MSKVFPSMWAFKILLRTCDCRYGLQVPIPSNFPAFSSFPNSSRRRCASGWSTRLSHTFFTFSSSAW